MAKVKKKQQGKLQNKVRSNIQVSPPQKKPWWKRLGVWIGTLITLTLTVAGLYAAYLAIGPSLSVDVIKEADLFDASFELKNDGKFLLRVSPCNIRASKSDFDR